MRKTVLWGHQIADYQDMFDLSSNDFSLNVLDFAGGPNAVNSFFYESGFKMKSMDPLFALNFDALQKKINILFEERRRQIILDAPSFDFSRYGSLDDFVAVRREGLETFFSDYEVGLEQGRYLNLQGQVLPFGDYFFDLALSSHYLFEEHDLTQLDNHLLWIRELARVAKEVRIFPLVDHQGKVSTLLGPVLLALQQEGYWVELKKVTYCLQAAGHAMLLIRALACPVKKRT